MRKLLWLAWVLVCLVLCAPAALAAAAEEISGRTLITEHSGFSDGKILFDGRTMESLKIRQGGRITLFHEKGIGSLYIVLGTEYGGVPVTDEDTGETVLLGGTGYLHEFFDLTAAFGHAPRQVTLSFEGGEASVNEISAFTEGRVPDWVQRWAPPAEGEADLVLFSTHGDDEQLFFAGMLPYYARERGYNVQVVYMTDHRNMTMRRSHEMLDGLWAVGVRNYPVFGPFGDYNTRSLQEAYQKYSYKGITKEDILSFVVENVRRFRPKVAVGHDLQGEYGHGMHMIYAELLCEAAEISMDPQQFPQSAGQYGVWEIPKTYLHLYDTNQICMDWDIPLASFDGMTAYEVTKNLGFPCHVSQQIYYAGYFSGKDRASDITENSPCAFGLYRSTVGPDREGADFFENLTTHGEDALREQMRQEELRRLEQEAAVQTEPPAAEPEETAQPLVNAAEPEKQLGDSGIFRENMLLPAGIVLIFLGLLAVWKGSREEK